MASKKQTQAAKRNVKKAQSGARKKKSIANMPKKTRTALGKQAAAVAQRKRTGGSSPKTRAELYEMAKKRDLSGRAKMGRAERGAAPLRVPGGVARRAPGLLAGLLALGQPGLAPLDLARLQ